MKQMLLAVVAVLLGLAQPLMAERRAGLPSAQSTFTPVDWHQYPDNMTMVVLLKDGQQTVDTCEVAAFIDGECRCAARAHDSLYYLVIAGEGSGQKIEIRTVLNGLTVTIDDTLVYAGDKNVGTPWEPYVIGISDFLSAKSPKGDVNGDRKVDVADIATIIDVMAGTVGSDSATATAMQADVNQDGKVDVADIATIIDVMAASARMKKIKQVNTINL